MAVVAVVVMLMVVAAAVAVGSILVSRSVVLAGEAWLLKWGWRVKRGG